VLAIASPYPRDQMRASLDHKRIATMSFRTTLLAACFAAVLATSARAGAADYAFEPVEADIRKGDGVTISVRLVNKVSNKPVADAVIIATRIDMAPDGMAAMDAPLTPMPSHEPGVYAFKTDLVMAGRWRLSVAAKVQGEPETVKGEIIYTASP
jgi:YtkA-like